MLRNSSLSFNDSVLHPEASVYSIIPIYCLLNKPGSYIFTIYLITNIFLLLPLGIFILYHGFQQGQQKLSSSSAATMSHSDCFTYHMVVMEMIVVFGCILCCIGAYIYQHQILVAGVLMSCLTWHGETLFNVLMCVERYLAVVHPVTYMSLRNERGIRMRNVSIGCVWLLCLTGMVLMFIEKIFLALDFCILILALTITSFCSLSVLCVLLRPGPGGQGRGRERVDQSKQRAFYTIIAILGLLVLRFTWGMTRAALFVLKPNEECLVLLAGFWCYLPSSFVLPLLFLYRTGKLVCCKTAPNEVKG